MSNGFHSFYQIIDLEQLSCTPGIVFFFFFPFCLFSEIPGDEFQNKSELRQFIRLTIVFKICNNFAITDIFEYLLLD